MVEMQVEDLPGWIGARRPWWSPSMGCSAACSVGCS